MSALSLIDAHLEQMSLCAASIAELPFPKPKIFTNALLQPHDITALIRDTEAHERALFSVPPPPLAPRAHDPTTNTNRRNTIFSGNNGPGSTGGGGANAVRAPKRNTAVASVLGGDLVERIRRGGGGGAGTGVGYRTYDGLNKGEVDVEVLLEGAEKLCGVYPLPGAMEKIAALRQRHWRLLSSVKHYEDLVEDQKSKLTQLNRPLGFDEGRDEGFPASEDEQDANSQDFVLSEDELRKEEEEIRELQRKKQILEERVASLGKEITGVLR